MSLVALPLYSPSIANAFKGMTALEPPDPLAQLWAGLHLEETPCASFAPQDAEFRFTLCPGNGTLWREPASCGVDQSQAPADNNAERSRVASGRPLATAS